MRDAGCRCCFDVDVDVVLSVGTPIPDLSESAAERIGRRGEREWFRWGGFGGVGMILFVR